MPKSNKMNNEHFIPNSRIPIQEKFKNRTKYEKQTKCMCEGYIGKDGHGQAATDRRTRTRGHERRTVMEKTGTYVKKGGQLWKRRTVMEKTDTYGKDGHLWKRRTLTEKTGIKHKKAKFLVESLTPCTTSITHIVRHTEHTSLGIFRTHTKKRTIDLSNIPKCSPMAWGLLMRFIGASLSEPHCYVAKRGEAQWCVRTRNFSSVIKIPSACHRNFCQIVVNLSIAFPSSQLLRQFAGFTFRKKLNISQDVNLLAELVEELR